MRIFFALLLLSICNLTFSQTVPQHINYQAILRDGAGTEVAVGASAVINVRIYNSLSDATSNPFYEENHNVVVPVTRVINLKIGQGTQVSSNAFSAINWPTGEVNYLISVNATPIGTRQVFSSVPYAFYTPGSSGNTYSASANISTTGNILDLSTTGVTAGSYGGNSTAYSKIPGFTVDSKGRLFQANEFNANIGGDIAGKLDSQTVVKLRNYPLLNINPVPGQVLQYNASGWSPATLTVSSSSTYTGSNGISVVGSGPNYSIVPVTNATVGVWSTVGNSNTNGSNGFIGTTDSNPFIIRTGNSIRAFFNGLNGNLGLGTLNPAYRLHSVTTTGAVPIFGDNASTANNPQAYGIIGSSSSTSTLSAGLFGQSLGNGSGVNGINTNSVGTNVFGVYGQVTNSTSPTNAGVLGDGRGLETGVLGRNFGTGTAVEGVQSSSTTGTASHAGRFRITGVNNNASALYATTTGTGAAIQGQSFSSATDALAGLFNGKLKTDSIAIVGPNSPVPGALLTARDASGNAKWSPGPVAFNYQFAPFTPIAVNTNTVNNLGNTTQFSTLQSVNVGGGFNTTNSQFTAPVTGVYHFEASLYIILNSSGTGNNWIYLDLCKAPASPVVLKRAIMNNQDGTITTYQVLQVSVIANLTAGETVFLRAVGASGGGGGSITNNNQPQLINSFSGYLIR